MAQQLHTLEVREVSLVDHPANSSVDPVTGKKTPRARVALFKRDTGEEVIPLTNFTKEELDEFEKAVHGRTQEGTTYPKSDYAYTPDDVPSHWKLRLTSSPGGKPDAGIVGAAIAALGKGFRGNKVQIPSDDLSAVKARVRAAWKQANPDKSSEEIPEVIKGETQSMTLAEIEKKMTDMDVVVTALKSENDILKKERELVIKMSKSERTAYAAMDSEEQKKFMGADNTTRKNMCDTAMTKIKQKAAEDSMDDATKSEYKTAGPARRLQLIGAQIEKMEKTDDEEDLVPGVGEKKVPKIKTKAAKVPPDDEDDDEEGDEENLELRKQLAVTSDRLTKAETTLLLVTKKNELDHFTKRAETELPNTPGSPESKGDYLFQLSKSLGGENSELFKTTMENLKKADEALAKSFNEIGKAGSEGAIPAEKVFFAKVDEIAKRDKISNGKAVAKAMDENPDLYLAYEQGHRRAIRSVA